MTPTSIRIFCRRAFSAYFDGHSRRVTWLVSRRLIATCALVLSDPAGRLCILYVTIKDKAFRLIGVYGPNANSEQPAFFRRIKPYMIPSKRVILGGDWNAVILWMLDIFASLSKDLTSSTNFARDIQISYACHELDDGTEGTPRRRVFFFLSDPGVFLQAPNQSQNPV